MATSTTDTTLLAAGPVAGYKQSTAADVKAWAAENGLTVHAGRGRMPLSVVHAYNKANRRNRRQYVLGSGVAATRTFPFTTAAGRESTFQATNKEVRTWAQAQEGLTVGAKGAFSREVLNAYGQAHAKARTRKPKAAPVEQA
jgi:hypothetical protein